MNNARRMIWVVFVVFVATATQAVPLKNHAFDVDPTAATVCLDGVFIVGEATGTDALNVLMTSQVFNQAGTTLIGAGDTHTFTTIGETFTFTVLYAVNTFNVGDPVGLSVTDVPGTLTGNQGDFANSATVADCRLPLVPAIPGAGLVLLALGLVAGGAVLLARRSPQGA